MLAWARVLATVVYIFVAIGCVCYYFLEVRHLSKVETNWAIGMSLAIVLIPALVSIFYFGEPDSFGDYVRRSRYLGEREAAKRKRLKEVKGREDAEKWLPLIENGMLLSDAEIASRNQRIAELEAVPHRRNYSEVILKGGQIRDEEIDYLELSDQFELCEHMRKMEIEGKREGLLRWVDTQVVHGNFVLKPEAARRAFELPQFVAIFYSPSTNYRDPDDYHTVSCAFCNCKLHSSGYGPQWPVVG